MSDTSASENRLLVPISIEALVVEKDQSFGSDLSLDFSRLYERDTLGSRLTPGLFQSSKQCFYGSGVHLHWALPAAHRRGGNVLARARRMANVHGVLAERLAKTPDEAERKRLAKRLTELWKRLTELVRGFGDQPAAEKAATVAKLDAEQAAALAQLSGTLDEAERKRLAKRLASAGKSLADVANQESQGKLQFPVIPNRWLVQRLCGKPNTNEISVRAWVVESDYRYSYDPEDDQTAKPDSAITLPLFDALPLFDYVGKNFTYPDWEEGKDQASRIELTALGYGDPAFAAYYPACKSVLGFHDPLSDVQPDSALTYLVAGWYSDPAKDILRCFDMEELSWICSPPPDADSYPDQTLCHGSIFDLQWKRKAGDGKKNLSKIPFLDNNTCTVAIGNTSAEAMAALLTKTLNKKPALETLLTAFNDDLLDKDADYREMESRLHQHRFGSSGGGTQFFINKKEAEEGQPLTATDANLPKDLQDALADLNNRQQSWDRQARELEADRWELYATWSKWALKYLDNNNEPAEITAILRREKDRVREKEQQLTRDKNSLAGKRNDLANTVATRFSDLEFVKSVSPPFWHANDPAVLISAPGLSPSSQSRRGRRDAEKERLACRVTGQEITALLLNIPNGPSGIGVSADEIFQIQNAVSRDAPGLPQGIEELLREALLLNPAHSDAIAEKAYRNAGLQTTPEKERLVATIKELQRPHKDPNQILTQPAPITAASSGLKGFFPDLIALRDWDGNPWLPLFLEWEVSWASSYTSLDKTLEHWQLVTQDGEAREDGEFHWVGETPALFPTIYQGYSILAPHAAWNLEERLEKYNEDKQDKDLDRVNTQLGDMNILAQTLGGLHNAFIMRDQIVQPRPINPRIFAGHPEEHPTDPIIDFITGLNNLVSPAPDKPFFPVRAGHLKLIRVSIVDAFGQTVEVPIAGKLIRAASLKMTKVDGAEGFVQLGPRFAQPLRLRFDWLPAKNPAETFPVDSPVCGWVIPNHLDNNLLFYDASGAPLGVLQKIMRLTAAGATGGVADADAKAFFWVPMPGTSQQPETIHNPELKYFVQFLERMGADNGDAFWNLLDDALAKTDPGEPEHDPLLSVLLGRPLALARASLQLELDGLPASDQRLDKIGQHDTGGFTKVKFPVCLGEAANGRDGLVGFFIHDSKSDVAGPFYAAAGAEVLPGLPVTNVIEYKTSHDMLDCETPVALTLLMDPRARIHLTTGILPKRSVELPSRVSSAAKSAKEAFFQVAPLIAPDEDVIMPKPSDDFGKWSWGYRPQVTLWQEAKEIIAASDRAGFHPRPQQISEGWLKLKMNPAAILSFWVKEGTPEVAMDTNVTLAWVLQGGDRLILLANDDDKSPIRVWDDSPLPEQYRVQVKDDVTYTLILLNKDNSKAEKRLTIRLAKGNSHG